VDRHAVDGIPVSDPDRFRKPSSFDAAIRFADGRNPEWRAKHVGAERASQRLRLWGRDDVDERVCTELISRACGPGGDRRRDGSRLLAAVAMRRGQLQGPTNDQETEDFVYDALELLPGAADVEVRCDSGRLTLTGNVQHKRLKRDVGEIAWAIPSLVDVLNNVTITSRRRPRNREEAVSNVSARKQA